MTSDTKGTTARKNIAEVVAIVQSFARAYLTLRGARCGKRIRCYGRLLVEQPAGLEIGSRVVFLRGPIPTELRCEHGGELAIGSNTLLNHGVSVVARRSVRIGARCMLAPLVHVRDDDGRRTAPVTIGHDVWLAHGAVVEPGSIIGDGSVVAAMTVVSGTIPPHTLAAGNPAQWFPLESSPVELAAKLENGDGRRPSRDQVRRTIIEWLDDTRHFGAAASLIASDSTSLVAAGLLDSLGVVELTHMLEERFGVSIDRERAAAHGAQSLDALIDMVAVPEGSLP